MIFGSGRISCLDLRWVGTAVDDATSCSLLVRRGCEVIAARSGSSSLLRVFSGKGSFLSLCSGDAGLLCKRFVLLLFDHELLPVVSL